MSYRNAIFLVTEEHSCPLYNVGEELEVRDMALSISSDKPACLQLVREILKATSDAPVFERFTQQGIQRAKFECGGCTGLVRFEFKKEREYATLQMKLLAAAEQRAKMRHVEEFYDLLRGMEIFEPLADNDLQDLSAMLKLKTYGPHKVIINRGERGTHLYIMLSGTVAVVRDGNEVLAEMGEGEVFGEMSLLSGEPVTTSVYSRTKVRIATLSAKDFKHVLNKYPILQVFFYRMLVDRAQVNSLRSGTISSGMTGELAEINAVELFQLINSSGKTGRVDLLFASGRATVLFNEGEIVKAVHGKTEGKEALFALLARNKGTFTYTSGLDDADRDLPVLGGFMGLIMEGLRRIDEEV
jgi:CRP-like cAMP-binding protein